MTVVGVRADSFVAAESSTARREGRGVREGREEQQQLFMFGSVVFLRALRGLRALRVK
jgi:hypothetical protein